MDLIKKYNKIHLIVNSFGSERLEKELHGLLPASISNGIRVIPPPYGVDTAWFGAKLVSNVSYLITRCYLYLNEHQKLLVLPSIMACQLYCSINPINPKIMVFLKEYSLLHLILIKFLLKC